MAKRLAYDGGEGHGSGWSAVLADVVSVRISKRAASGKTEMTPQSSVGRKMRTYVQRGVRCPPQPALGRVVPRSQPQVLSPYTTSATASCFQFLARWLPPGRLHRVLNLQLFI